MVVVIWFVTMVTHGNLWSIDVNSSGLVRGSKWWRMVITSVNVQCSQRRPMTWVNEDDRKRMAGGTRINHHH